MANLLFPLLLVVLLVPMFLGVRRQKREAQKVADMQESVKVGDQVTTTSGLYGTVVDLDDESVDLEIAEDVVTTWLRAAIRDVRPSTDGSADAADSETAEVSDSAATDAEAAGTPATNGAPSTNGSALAEESVEDTAARLRKD
ncbi:putative preprotein translocase YajC subunit [Nocardia nova SH22a]|uniref:Putative preprotein translocase YajC subunit n=1 Tax=Nocardia nova SH22a TaxID=1415166 RepID=W5TJ98_9NOCA|nr:preprotein translocase subunit YajC [Nocardia nova]AHH19380.1 putative preprotein translocase YajC subunit [Nocardia nova SH22a]